LSEHEHVHGDGCECEEEPTFVVTDENGVDHEMIMVMSFDVNDRQYAVLLDKNDPEADGLLFRIEEEDDDLFLVNIEDDEEWDAALAAYNEIAGQESAEAENEKA
jgi:uncharacterized protein YrzB (UPF0473 family)